MFLTKECDYALRTIRALAGGEKTTAQEICAGEHIPKQYAYKIFNKLEQAGFIKSYRGRDGGYQLARPLDSFAIHDVVCAIDENLFITQCLREDDNCPHKADNRLCTVHLELDRIQKVLVEEMRRKTILELASG